MALTPSSRAAMESRRAQGVASALASLRLLGAQHGRAGRLRACPLRAKAPPAYFAAYREGLCSGFRGGLIAAARRKAAA